MDSTFTNSTLECRAHIPLQRSRLWDRIGVTFASLCAVHCLLVPVVMLALPLWPVHDHLHLVFAVLLLPVTLLAVRARWGRNWWAVGYLGLGWLLILSAVLLHDTGGLWLETGLTLIGGGLSILGHRCRH